MKELRISFGSIFLLFSVASSWGGMFIIAGENPWPPAFNGSRKILFLRLGPSLT